MTALYFDAATRRRTVLVVVMNNPDDLQHAAADGWYRIPQHRAPRRIGADYLAFYQTSKFLQTSEARSISYFAPTRRYRLVTRRELLPDQPTHPRADDYYFCIHIGPLERLERPVPSASLRRITFIHTTFDRLLTATDLRDLYREDDPFDRLWHALRENRLRPLQNRLVGERPMDIALRARGGYLGILCTNETRTQESTPAAQRWDFLSLPYLELETDFNGCLRRIGAALIQLGGSDLRTG